MAINPHRRLERNKRFTQGDRPGGPIRAPDPDAFKVSGPPAAGAAQGSSIGSRLKADAKGGDLVQKVQALAGGQEGRRELTTPGLPNQKAKLATPSGEAAATPGAKQPAEVGGPSNRAEPFITAAKIAEVVAAGAATSAAGAGTGAPRGSLGLQGQAVQFGPSSTQGIPALGRGTPASILPSRAPTAPTGPNPTTGRALGITIAPGVSPDAFSASGPSLSRTMGLDIAARQAGGALKTAALNQVGFDKDARKLLAAGKTGTAFARAGGNLFQSRIGSPNPGGPAPRSPREEEGLPPQQQRRSMAAPGNPRFTRRRR